MRYHKPTVIVAGDAVSDNGQQWWRSAAILSMLGMIMALSVVVGFALGYALDLWLGTLPWLSVAGLVLGVIAGFREAIRIIRRFARDF